MNRLAVRIAERQLSQPGRLLRSVFVAAAAIVVGITAVQLYLGPAPARGFSRMVVSDGLWIPSGSIGLSEEAKRRLGPFAHLGLPLACLEFEGTAAYFQGTDWGHYLDSVRVSPFALAADICFVGVLLLVGAAFLLRAFRRHLSRRRVHQLCVRCGYCLQGLPSDACPECGTSVRGRRVWMHCRDATAFYRAVFAVALLQATCIIEFVLLRVDMRSIWHCWRAADVAATLQDAWFLGFGGLSIIATTVVWHFERRTIGFARRRVPLAIVVGVMQVATLWLFYGLTALRIGAS